MADIDDQLRTEIASLEGHIARTEDRFLATRWVAELLPSLQRVAADLPAEELECALTALRRARDRFHVNGHLSVEIDELLNRFGGDGGREEAGEAYSEALLTPADDPGDTAEGTAQVLFEDEDEEEAQLASLEDDEPPDYGAMGGLFADDHEPEATEALGSGPAHDADEAGGADGLFVEEEEAGPVVALPLAPEASQPAAAPITQEGVTQEGSGISSDGLFDDAPGPSYEPFVEMPGTGVAAFPEEEAAREAPERPSDELFEETPGAGIAALPEEEAAREAPERPSDELFEETPGAGIAALPEEAAHEPPPPLTDELFDVKPRAPARPPEEARPGASPRPGRTPKEPAPGMPHQDLKEVAASINIFSHTVALDDLQAALDITVPSQDLIQLENLLRARLTDKVVAALRESKVAARQYILMPRVRRFYHDGSVVPCTVRNLAKAYTKLFGDLRDLRPFIGDRVVTGEVPELGWSLITAEAPRESLGKSFMDQNQYMRYLATSLGIPSHLVRRRTLVEAVYDVIVGRLVLGQALQRQTLDWTASSVTKNDYLCLYSAEEGIRVRALSRTTRHPALGICPNW